MRDNETAANARTDFVTDGISYRKILAVFRVIVVELMTTLHVEHSLMDTALKRNTEYLIQCYVRLFIDLCLWRAARVVHKLKIFEMFCISWGNLFLLN